MKSIAALILAFTYSGVIFSQEVGFKKPDYIGIEKIIKDESSEFYYPKLFAKYNNNDTSLSIQAFRVLYYGYLFNEKYSPYGNSDYFDSLSVFYQKDTLTIQDFQKIIHYEKLILHDYPFNLRDINSLAYSLFNIGEAEQANQLRFKLHMLVETILSTGDGRSNETGWHVISVSHEYDILNILGFKYGGQQSLSSKGCDILSLAENEFNIKEIYFDVNKILDAERDLFK